MGEIGEFSTRKSIVTSHGFTEETQIDAHMVELRADIQSHLEESFKTLPEVRTASFPIKKYIRENPQSVIFVPQKDMNMYPVLIEEAQAFAAKYGTEQRLDQVRDHELEHTQKMYELGVEVKGAGLVTLNYKSKPTFGGFVTTPEDQEMSLRDELRIKLAPRTLAFQNTGDMLDSEILVIRALARSKTPQKFESVLSDVFFVISERYLPPKVHSLLQKVIK